MNNLQNAFQAFKDLDRKFPINAALVFLYIAKHEPCLKQDMENALGLTSASGSRNTSYLCDSNRLKKPGLGLIVKQDSIEDRRHSDLTLTDKGRQFYQLIA